MSTGAWVMLALVLVSAGTVVFLIFSMTKSILNERSADRGIWRDFGLSLALMVLFFSTWVGQAVAEWQTFTDQQRVDGQPIKAGDFMAEFAQSTLENWQSEFLQLFSFVVLAALYIHKGSAESKDGSDRIEAALRRVEERLGTLPERSDATASTKQQKDRPVR